MMKRTLAISGMVIFSLIAMAVIFRAKTEATSNLAPGERRPVIVELFTSEGCSSCPPADQFLVKLESEQPIPNVEIIALEQHVDYWNNLGWVDPFSSDASTIRQYAYAGQLGNGNAYTPQMVVDGQNEFVGSRERQARGEIQQAGTREKAEISVMAAETRADGTPQFRVTIGKLTNVSNGDTPEVWVAVTETGFILTLNAERTRAKISGTPPWCETCARLGRQNQMKRSPFPRMSR